MIELRRILCPVDFSPATAHALRPAISLATEYGAELFLVHILDYPYPHLDALSPAYDITPYYQQMEEEAGQRLDQLVEEETGEFLAAHAVVRRGAPFLEIISMAKEKNIDLIVMPTRGRRGVDRLLFGSVAEKVVRLASCPVLTLSPGGEESAPFAPARVLHPTDFSGYSDHALPYAESFARRYSAELLMVHVVTVWDYDPSNPEWRFPPLPQEQQAAAEEAARQALEGHGASTMSDGLKVERRIVKGFDPPVQIVRTAEEAEADLIVMATHGRTGLKHVLLGSTTEKVIRLARCPVLTVKNPEHEFVLP
ncbi:MAG: universal stress protein [Acidobacteriota bacterium]